VQLLQETRDKLLVHDEGCRAELAPVVAGGEHLIIALLWQVLLLEDLGEEGLNLGQILPNVYL
jgi:hypothetical protein